LENITPNRIIVSGAGIESHDEFVELVNAKLSYMPAGTTQSSIYLIILYINIKIKFFLILKVDGKTSSRTKS
jgi:hypothetical protein